jgi:hypothetical protein
LHLGDSRLQSPTEAWPSPQSCDLPLNLRLIL